MLNAHSVIGSDVSDVILPLRRIKWQEATKKASNSPVSFAAYQGRDDVVGKTIGGMRYTNQDYSTMLQRLFDHGEVCKHPIETGAVSAMRTIGVERLRLVTSLRKDAVGHIETMLRSNGLAVPVTSTDGRSKLRHVKSFGAFVDNCPEELDEMRGLVPVRILFDMYGDSSAKSQAVPRGVTRAESWPHVLRILQENELLQKAA
jgi:hypothetical protein